MTTHDIDPITGLLRRVGFLTHLDEHLALARQSGGPVAVLALDVDHLAYVNYYFGPAAAEAALGMVATVLRARVHQGILARFGGDEFYAILPHVALADALIVAERVRQAAVTIDLDDPSPGVPPRCLSFSLTVVACPEHGHEARRLLALIEQGLMAAKRQGRDTVYRFP